MSNMASMTRRCVFAAAGLAAAGAAATEPPAAVDLPRAELLGDGDVRTYLLVYHTGQEVMKGLLAFARKHKLTAGQVTGTGAVSSEVIGYFDPEKKAYLRHHEKEQLEVLLLTGNLALDRGHRAFVSDSIQTPPLLDPGRRLLRMAEDGFQGEDPSTF
jgi:hypothetical protein